MEKTREVYVEFFKDAYSTLCSRRHPRIVYSTEYIDRVPIRTMAEKICERFARFITDRKRLVDFTHMYITWVKECGKKYILLELNFLHKINEALLPVLLEALNVHPKNKENVEAYDLLAEFEKILATPPMDFVRRQTSEIFNSGDLENIYHALFCNGNVENVVKRLRGEEYEEYEEDPLPSPKRYHCAGTIEERLAAIEHDVYMTNRTVNGYE